MGGAYIFESAQSHSKNAERTEENPTSKRCRIEGMAFQCLRESGGENEVVIVKSIKGFLCRPRIPASRRHFVLAALVLSTVGVMLAVFLAQINATVWSGRLLMLTR